MGSDHFRPVLFGHRSVVRVQKSSKDFDSSSCSVTLLTETNDPKNKTMPSTCAAIDCANRGSRDSAISYHRFPLNDPELLKAWMEKMPFRDWTPSRWSKLCSVHFADNCFYQLNNKTYLKQGSVPTVFSSPASKTKRSPRKRLRSQSDQASLLCQQLKQRHRSSSPERQPGSTTEQSSPGEAHAAAGSGSSVEMVTSPSSATTSETPPEAVFMRHNTSSGDHSYAAVSPRLQRVLLATGKHELQEVRKLLKQAKKETSRKMARIRKLNTLLCQLRSQLPKPAVRYLTMHSPTQWATSS
ncbi:THAP domain-containing protein 3 [Ixodes scapularis]|uniref:THAP domain-containing protein 3 n=1 Tax=Ixodes scapularis TaxID=6945 RepID=UPI001A9DC199|nr:THAP domain-containing protein 3 [Ixodes scapularis]